MSRWWLRLWAPPRLPTSLERGHCQPLPTLDAALTNGVVATSLARSSIIIDLFPWRIRATGALPAPKRLSPSQTEQGADHEGDRWHLQAEIDQRVENCHGRIWPETAVPYLIAEMPETRKAIAAVVPPGGALLTGTIRRTADFEEYSALLNSLVSLIDSGDIVAAYDKVRLVPFGEYMPLGRILPIKKLTEGSIDYIPGDARIVFAAQSQKQRTDRHSPRGKRRITQHCSAA